jgi:hypothetical protein
MVQFNVTVPNESGDTLFAEDIVWITSVVKPARNNTSVHSTRHLKCCRVALFVVLTHMIRRVMAFWGRIKIFLQAAVFVRWRFKEGVGYRHNVQDGHQFCV